VHRAAVRRRSEADRPAQHGERWPYSPWAEPNRYRFNAFYGFVEGARSAFDLSGTTLYFPVRLMDYADDWAAIGADLWAGVHAFEREHHVHPGQGRLFELEDTEAQRDE
jgi:hypothetical protein